MLHPAPSLSEAPPQADETRAGTHNPESPDSSTRRPRSLSSSPPLRKDTLSSTSTSLTNATGTSFASGDTPGTALGADVSPSFSNQSIFSVKDGADVSPNRRAANNRRRTGPLSASQREKAALIRKLGACADCRRRRVACHPTHHNMSWEDAKRKYRAHSPTLQELAPLVGRTLSPAPLSSKSVYSQDPQEMDVDNPQTPRAERLSFHSNDSRVFRRPLPSAPRPDKPSSAPITLPGIENFKTQLQDTIAHVLSDDKIRRRYTTVQALLLHWQDDPDPEVRRTVEELAGVLERDYHYTFEIAMIPSSRVDESGSSSRWLSRKIGDLVDHRDSRDALKIIYYTGNSYLDSRRDMVLASYSEKSATIRWNVVQGVLEASRSDILVILDSAYYASAKITRETGALEVIAASASEDHARHLGRTTFTRALTRELQDRVLRRYRDPFSAAELHAKLFSEYPAYIRERQVDRPIVTSSPAPLHILITENTKLPSILLAPLSLDPIYAPDLGTHAPHVSLTFNLASEPVHMEDWEHWLRMMPEGIKDLKLTSPYRHTLH